MATIQLRGLLAVDAEKAIARIWYVLEQRGIVSPRIEACQGVGDRINIDIAFGAQRDADITRNALEGLWAVAVDAPTAGQGS